MEKAKTSKQLERHFKGISNYRRIEVLFLLRNHESMTLEELAGRLKCNFKTLSEHTRRLQAAGLLNKAYKGRTVMHTLSPYGKKLAKLIKSF